MDQAGPAIGKGFVIVVDVMGLHSFWAGGRVHITLLTSHTKLYSRFTLFVAYIIL